jgi:hypothetical protein
MKHSLLIDKLTTTILKREDRIRSNLLKKNKEYKDDNINSLLRDSVSILAEIKALCNANDQGLRLLGGEMSAQEMRTLRAFLDFIDRRIK